MTTHTLKHPAAADANLSWPSGWFRFATDHFLLLPVGGLIALVWANTRPESYFSLAQTLRFAVNDIGMALFFALIAQEVVEAVVPGGALHTWRRWTLPVVAAAGAVAGSALVYVAYVSWNYEMVLQDGWPVAAAIDLAFAYMLVRALFGRHAAVPFLLVVAIAANAVGIIVVASRQPFVHIQPGGTVLIMAALVAAFLFRRMHLRSFWPYLLICGPLAWWALYLDGFNPALALVPIVPFVPHSARSLMLFEDKPHSSHDSPRHLEHVLKYPVQVVLFLFGLVNAGVLVSGYGTGTWALLAGALVGKPVGLLAGIAIALAAGLHLPRGLHWRDLVVVALATSGGFAFALFFATAVYPLGPVLGELKLGAIASGIGVLLTVVAAWFLGVGRFHHVGQRA
jgi:NhaA family Na+:H+ antiporter